MKKLLIYLPAIMVMIMHTYQVSAQDAREILKRSEDKIRGETSEAEVTMKIIRPDWTREMGLKSWSKGTEYALILITSPARDQGITFLKREKEMWNWQPSIERTIKLPPSMLMQSWMGSDFTNDDLVRESSILEDYTHKILGSDNIEGRDCYKIEMIPHEEAPVVWGKVIMWVDKQEYMQLKIEFFDEDDYLINTLRASKIKEMGGRVIPTYMEMIPEDKEGHKTAFEYKSIKFNEQIEDEWFSIQNMKKIH